MDILTSTFTTTLSAVTHLVSFPTSTITTFLRPLDTLFNIPLVSVLLLPSLSSWSTSFNVLFFYATWSLLLFSHGRIAVEFWGTLLIRLVFFVVPSTLFLVLDGCLPFVMRSIKQHGEAGIASIAARQTGRTRASRARGASRTAASMSGGEILRRVASSIKTRSTRRSRRSYGSDTTGTTRASEGAGVFGSRWWWLRMVSLSLFNIMLGILLQTSIAWILARLNDKRKNARGALRVAAALPLPWAMIKQLIAAWVLREVIAYTTHRYLLHADGTGSTASATSHAASANSSDEDGSYVYESNDSDNNSYFASRALRPKSKPIFLLRTLTSWHATHYHTSNLVVPVPFSAHYDHPVAYLLRIWLPDYLPAAILHMHLLTYHLWLALLSIEESLVYSNYSSLPTGLLLGGMARRAERHMLTGGCGNFAPYGVVDLLMGTSVSTSASGAVSSAIAAALDGTEEGDDEYENLLEDAVYEANRRNIPERARRKGRMIRDKFEEEMEMGEGGGSEGNGSGRAGRANGGPPARKSRTSNARRSKSRRRGGADSDAEWVGDDNDDRFAGSLLRNETGSGSRRRTTTTRASGRAKEGDKSDKSKSRSKKGESYSKESGGLFRRVRKTVAG